MSLSGRKGVFEWDLKEVHNGGGPAEAGTFLHNTELQPGWRSSDAWYGDSCFTTQMSPGLDGWRQQKQNRSPETTHRSPAPMYNPYFHPEDRSYQDGRYSQTGRIANWEDRHIRLDAYQYLPSADAREHPLWTVRGPANEIYSESQYDGTSRGASFDYNRNNAPCNLFAAGNFHDRDVNVGIPVKRVKRDAGWDPTFDTGNRSRGWPTDSSKAVESSGTEYLQFKAAANTDAGMGVREFAGARNMEISRESNYRLPFSNPVSNVEPALVGHASQSVARSDATSLTRQQISEANGPSSTAATQPFLSAVGQNQPKFASNDPRRELFQPPSQEGGLGGRADVSCTKRLEVNSGSTTSQSILSAEQLSQLGNLSAMLSRLFGTGQQLATLNGSNPVEYMPSALSVSAGPAIASAQPNSASGSQKMYDPAVTDSIEGRKKVTVEEGKTGGDNADVEKRDEDEVRNGKALRAFKFALAEYVKDLLTPTWKEGRVGKEEYKTIVKKVVDKVIATIQGVHIPQTRDQINIYLSSSKPKLEKLLQAYVEKYHKNKVT